MRNVWTLLRADLTLNCRGSIVGTPGIFFLVRDRALNRSWLHFSWASERGKSAEKWARSPELLNRSYCRFYSTSISKQKQHEHAFVWQLGNFAWCLLGGGEAIAVSSWSYARKTRDGRFPSKWLKAQFRQITHCGSRWYLFPGNFPSKNLLAPICCSLCDFGVYGGGEICLDLFRYRLRSVLLFAECAGVCLMWIYSFFFKANFLHSGLRDHCHNSQDFMWTS